LTSMLAKKPAIKPRTIQEMKPVIMGHLPLLRPPYTGT
jgi:hypothetical protein